MNVENGTSQVKRKEMFELLLGHLAGDYLLQNEWMAQNKSKNTLIGWLAALVHCIIYTLAVCLFMQNFQPIWMVVVFLTHFPIDKFSLAEHYMHYIKRKSLYDYIYNGFHEEPFPQNPPIPKQQTRVNRVDVLVGGFSAVVYTITDNTMHLILMWGAYKLIY